MVFLERGQSIHALAPEDLKVPVERIPHGPGELRFHFFDRMRKNLLDELGIRVDNSAVEIDGHGEVSRSRRAAERLDEVGTAQCGDRAS